jgi:DNA-binding CsgD family transcriptional regulator
MKTTEINDRDRQMLELLAEGASNRVVADRLGYREGTMRVYLHGLYRKLGVANKTSAVIWYFDRLKEEGRAAGAAGDGEAIASEESFGDVAWRDTPLAALGAMSMFLGAYGRLWEVANRLKGAAADPKADRRRWQSRQLFEALLRGDVAYGKRLYDEDQLARLLVDSPADAVLLACLLRIGGYTRAAERVHAQLARRRKGRPGLSTKEFALVTALREAFDGGIEGSLAGLYRLATENSSKPFPRHAAMVSLYWGYRSLKDRERAVATANALFAEAESVRQQLQAMGEKPLYRDGTVPQPGASRGRAPSPRPAKAAAKVALEVA